MQVDLFFYREPEEPKQQDEEAIAAPDYADYSAAGIGGIPGDQWSSQIPDSQWTPETAPPSISAVPGVGWTPDQGL